jgi:hypothetical protein
MSVKRRETSLIQVNAVFPLLVQVGSRCWRRLVGIRGLNSKPLQSAARGGWQPIPSGSKLELRGQGRRIAGCIERCWRRF